jgi:hypothetical protein
MVVIRVSFGVTFLSSGRADSSLTGELAILSSRQQKQGKGNKLLLQIRLERQAAANASCMLV